MKKMSSLGLFKSCCLVLLFVILVPYIGYTEDVSSKVINLRYSGFLPPGTEQEAIPEWYSKEISKRTDGLVNLRTFHGETLGKIDTFPEMLDGKVADMALLNFGQSAFLDTIWAIIYMPFTSPDDMVLTTKAFNMALQKGLFDSCLGKYKVMWYQPTPPQYIFLRDRKVESANDFKNLKISGITGAWSIVPEKLGATSVSVPGPEAYMSLDRKVVDARVTMPDFVLRQKLFEVVKYVPWYSIIGSNGFAVAMAKERWDHIPISIQKTMEELNKEAQDEWFSRFAVSTEEYRKKLEDSGIQTYELSDQEKDRWRSVIKPIIDGQLDKFSSRGLPARDLYNLYREIRGKL